MTDEEIKKAAQLLDVIEHHEQEIEDLNRRIAAHQHQIDKERDQLERLKRGELVVRNGLLFDHATAARMDSRCRGHGLVGCRVCPAVEARDAG